MRILLAYFGLLALARYVLPEGADSYYVQVLCLAGVNVVAAVGLNIVNGLTGQFSLGHAGFMAVGGYVAAAVTMMGFGPEPLPILAVAERRAIRNRADRDGGSHPIAL